MLERDAGVELLAGKEAAVAVIATSFRPFMPTAKRQPDQRLGLGLTKLIL
jgi:hypothetical protein